MANPARQVLEYMLGIFPRDRIDIAKLEALANAMRKPWIKPQVRRFAASDAESVLGFRPGCEL